MSQIRLQGNASGTGTLTIASPNTNSDFTLNLPASAGTFVVDGASQSPTFNAVTATSVATTTLAVNSNNISAANSLGFRNRIINGDMRIDQRNNGAAVTINNTAAYAVDRWVIEDGCDAVFSAQRTTDVPSGQGFTNSLQVTATTADPSIGSTQFAVITQFIEGFNSADLDFGSASAVSCTVSFWVKATVAGQYSCALYNNGASRINPQPFTVNSSNTWERKTITFAGDTTGTWLTNNGRGIVFNIYIALGSSFLGAAGWNSSSIYGVTGQANAVASVNNTFSITGVQLEAGTVATPFERRDYGRELSMCQRYFAILGGNIVGMLNGSGNATGTAYMPVPPRATPTISYSGTANMVAYGIGTYSSTTQPSGINVVSGSNNLLFMITGFGSTPTSGSGQLSNTTYLASMEL